MWLYVLIAVGSLPVLTTVIGVPWVFYAEWRRNRRIAAKWAEGERRLSNRWLADRMMADADWGNEYWRPGMTVEPPAHCDDLGQSSNPRARP